MPNPQLNIGNLDFDDIKASIKDYLSNQDVFKDYDFEASGLSTVLDVLSYNTLYYAFYSNMIANEMFLDTAQKLSSLISLAKPLGYVVPGARSAMGTVQIRAGGPVASVPKYNRFIGRDETGRSFNFYTIKEEVTDDNGTVELQIYQGSKLFQNVVLGLNNDRTKGFLGRTDVDIRSLTVMVTPPGDDAEAEEWYLSSDNNENINSDSKVFFLERTDTGFYIIFSGNISDGLNVGFGKPLLPNTMVEISYITSSGELGNGAGNFSPADWSQIDATASPISQTIYQSSGGSMEPNLDAVKFFAPKTFAAQDRVVTKNDAIAVLARDLIDEETPNADMRISVWGGEENDPPYYGRLFVSLLNENPEGVPNTGGEEIIQAIQTLKDKCVVTILPEYIGPLVMQLYMNMTGLSNQSQTSLSTSQLQARVTAALNEEFQGNRQFNKSIKESKILSIANGVDPSLSIDSSGITVKCTRDFIASEEKRSVYFRNPIKRITGIITNRSIQTTPTTGTFNGTNYTDLQVVDIPQSMGTNDYANLGLIRSVGGSYVSLSTNVGRVYYERGIVEIDENILRDPFNMTFIPKTNSFEGKQEVVVIPTFNVTITAEA